MGAPRRRGTEESLAPMRCLLNANVRLNQESVTTAAQDAASRSIASTATPTPSSELILFAIAFADSE
jgi:hypothetical protein